MDEFQFVLDTWSWRNVMHRAGRSETENNSRAFSVDIFDEYNGDQLMVVGDPRESDESPICAPHLLPVKGHCTVYSTVSEKTGTVAESQPVESKNGAAGVLELLLKDRSARSSGLHSTVGSLRGISTL
ncbi:hypothetical protein NDN08_002304 [Rhodosorus marinus]|uniref:Uncharacterized protein n=1 Tax=Rhodosorus marinus TaxID=101924 RepID=A0AAV8UUR5_9RHOD|nr:hypothetical protein NDN08_002304 [Rhodosorus marinus]